MVVKDKEGVSEQIEWNVETEVQLFYAMIGHKPVGVNKHFQMVCILEKFRNALNKDVSSKVIWNHLDTMYDMQALDDTENLPFPNDDRDFCLPETEFGELIEERLKLITNTDSSTLDVDAKKEPKIVKDVLKKESSNREIKESLVKKEPKEIKDAFKEIKRESKELTKEPKKFSKENKELRRESRESKDSKDGKKEGKRDSKEIPKEGKTESLESKDARALKLQRASLKDKREGRRDDTDRDDSVSVPTVKKERLKDTNESKYEDTSKRVGSSGSSSSSGNKRPTRGSLKPDDVSSSKSSSPVPTPTPPPYKRRRT